MKPAHFRRLAAGITISAAALTGSLLTTGTAHADTTTPADSTTVTGPAGDTWWGAPPADHPGGTSAGGNGTSADNAVVATPADTWWG